MVVRHDDALMTPKEMVKWLKCVDAQRNGCVGGYLDNHDSSLAGSITQHNMHEEGKRRGFLLNFLLGRMIMPGTGGILTHPLTHPFIYPLNHLIPWQTFTFELLTLVGIGRGWTELMSSSCGPFAATKDL